MNRLVLGGAIVGILVGVLVGFLWWGVPVQRGQADLDAARKRADALEQQLGEARASMGGLEAQLKTAQEDLRQAKEMNDKLQALVSRGKK